MEICEHSDLAEIRQKRGNYVRVSLVTIFQNCNRPMQNFIPFAYFFRILKKHIALKLESTKVYAKEENFQPKSVLESILMHKKENPVVAMTMCIDMFIAGIDTVQVYSLFLHLLC